MRLKFHHLSLFNIALYLLPIQSLSLPLFSSRYDLSCFLLLFIASSYLTNKPLLYRYQSIALLLFVLVIIFTYLTYSIPPVHRFISGIIWLGGCFLLPCINWKRIFNVDTTLNILYKSLVFTSLLVFAQYLLTSFNIVQIDRPSAFFDEPSYAGLFLFSGFNGMLIHYLLCKDLSHQDRHQIIPLAIIFLAGLLTRSTHLLLPLCLALFFVPHLLKNRLLFLLFAFASICSFILFPRFQTSGFFTHFISRIPVASSTNLSVLSWLEGFDQMRYSTTISQGLGLSLGSTGYFPFSSPFTQQIQQLGFYDSLNKTDAFSGFFRLGIEIGIYLSLALVLVILHRIFLASRLIRKILSNHSTTIDAEYISLINTLSLVTVGLSFLLGFLLKEPNYARSYVFFGFIFAFLPLPKTNSLSLPKL